jgi:hypothetical protein
MSECVAIVHTSYVPYLVVTGRRVEGPTRTEQVNVAALFRVVHPRTKQDDPRAITQHRMGGWLDGLDRTENFSGLTFTPVGIVYLNA